MMSGFGADLPTSALQQFRPESGVLLKRPAR
jgi:hypothetical protein